MVPEREDCCGSDNERAITRGASLCGECIETVHHVVGRDRPGHVNGQTLTRELVDDVEHLDGAQITRLVELKVHGPGDVGATGRIAPTTTPTPVRRFFLLRLGTFKPSSRQRRWILL